MTEETKKICPCPALMKAQEDIEHQANRLHEGDILFNTLTLKLETISKDTGEIKTDLRALKEKPGKRWDGLMDRIINWATLATLAYMFSAVFGNKPN